MKVNELPYQPEFFGRYINGIPSDLNLLVGLEDFCPTKIFDLKKLEELGDAVYAPGKWIGKEILQHCIDTERIMAYRALCFSRKEKASLPGFDENIYAANSLAHQRSYSDLMEEFECVRKSTIYLFRSFSEETLLQEGIANGKNILVGALGFVIIGHALHHQWILEERYYPLLSGKA
jgi:hypothetical protein